MSELRACFRLTNNRNINRSVSDGQELSIRKSSTSSEGCISSGQQQGRRWPSQLLYFYSAMSSAMVAPSLQNGTSSDSSKAAIAAAVKAASQAALQEKRFQGERANMMVWHCQHTRGDTLLPIVLHGNQLRRQHNCVLPKC